MRETSEQNQRQNKTNVRTKPTSEQTPAHAVRGVFVPVSVTGVDYGLGFQGLNPKLAASVRYCQTHRCRLEPKPTPRLEPKPTPTLTPLAVRGNIDLAER